MQPLTQHQIIDLVGPFTRRGRHVDLGASNRAERWLAFEPVEAGAGLRETLKPENPSDDRFRLTRSVQREGGLQGSLVAEGADAGELRQRIGSIAPQCLFGAGAGYATACSVRVEAPARGSATVAMVLTDAVAQVGGSALKLRVSRNRGIAADIELSAPADSSAVLPEDLLAVIAWDWSPLVAPAQSAPNRRARPAYSPAAARSAWALSVRSQENSGSSRPKCP